MLTPSLEDVVDSERETFEPVETVVDAVAVGIEAEIEDRVSGCEVGRLEKFGSGGGKRGASTFGEDEAGLEPGTIRIPTARTAGTRAISVGSVK